MITITRRQARRLRGVLRRPVLGIHRRDPVPPLVFRTTESEFRVEFQYQSLAAAYIGPAKETLIGDTIALPLESLADIEGSSEAPVRLVPDGFERMVAIYDSVGVGRRHEYDVPPMLTLEPFPETPRVWTPCPASLVVSMTTFAGAYGNDSTTDLDNEAKRGQAALALCRLLGGQVLLLGTTRTHVAVRSGPWTMLLPHGARVRTRQNPDPQSRRAHGEGPEQPQLSR